MDATYLVGSPATAEIMVEDNDAAADSPVITISADSNEVTEGFDAVFTITSNTPPAQGSIINVHYLVTQDGDFLGTFDAEDDESITSTGSVKLPISTIADTDDEADGSVTVQLVADTEITRGYSVGVNFKASIAIRDNDDDALPSVSIAFVKENLVEGTDTHAEFTISSTAGTSGPQDGDTLDVDVNITETGDFLDTAAGLREDITITIGTDYPLREMIVDDPTNEDDGTITATLVLKNTPTYGIGANPQAIINVSDNDGLPTLVYNTTSFSANEGDKPTAGSTPTPTVLTLDVGLTTESAQEIIVNYTFGDETNTNEATLNDDYTIPSTDTRSLNFPAGSTDAQTITINVTKDDLYEMDEEVTINFTIPAGSRSLVEFPTEAGPGGSVIDSKIATISNDDDMPSVSIADKEIEEGDSGSSTINFAVTLSDPVGVPVMINYVTADGSATAGEDYTGVSSTDNESITINASNNSGIENISGMIPVSISGDTTAERDETFEVEITDATNASVGSPDTATGTILSDDEPALSVESTTVGEGDGTVNVEVRLASPGATAIMVPWNTADGTANAGSDYTAATGTVTDSTALVFFGMDEQGYQIGTDGNRIDDGSGGYVRFTDADKVQTIPVTIFNDDRYEGDQTFVIQLGDVGGVEELDGGMGTVTISDNDNVPTINVAAVVSQDEPNDTAPVSDTNYDIAVTLSHESELEVTVGFVVTPGTAVATHDYVVNNASSKLTFDNLSVSENISLTIKADNIDENDETFKVDLTTATNAQFATNVTDSMLATNAADPQTIIINDNDDAPVISINNVDVTEGTDSGGTFTITQTPNSGKSVEVTVTYADVTATEGASEDYQITAIGFDDTTKTRTFVFAPADEPATNAMHTIAFTIRDDDLDEDAETFTMTLSNPDSSLDFTLDTTNNTHIGTATITDNDDEPTLTIADEMEPEGTAIVFTPTLSAVSGRDVVITYSTEASGNFPVSTDDYTAVLEADPAKSIDAETITIPAGRTTPTDTLSIATMQDTNPEPDETFTLNYSATNVSTETATGTATGTIENNDDRTIAITSELVSEAASTAELVVTISPAPDTDSGPITVTYTLPTDASNSAQPADYTHTTASLVFDPSDTSNEKTISFAIIDDNFNEGNEIITVQLMNADGIDLFGGGTGTITILDDDGTLPTVGLVKSKQTITEGTGEKTDAIKVTLTDESGTVTPSGRTVTVQYALTEGSAKDPQDYALSAQATGRLIFEPTVTSLEIPVDVVSDVYDEENEMFTVRLTNPEQATLGTASSMITITDNDDPPMVSIAEMIKVNETDTEIVGMIEVTLDTASGKTVTVPYTVTPGTAKAADYTFAKADVVFEPDNTTNGTTITATRMNIPFKITGDTLDENEEQFTITLGGSALANATINDSAKVGTVKIIDNDPEPTLTIADEMEPEGTAIVFTPTLSTESGRDVVITYSTEGSGNFPVSADDYTAVPVADSVTDPANPVQATTITIPAGRTTPTDTLSIATMQDTDPEPAETFTLNYSATNVSTETATGTATGTIENNDDRTIAITSDIVSEAAGMVDLVVTISPAADTDSGPITVTYTLPTDASDSAQSADYTHMTASLIFDPSDTSNMKTLSFEIIDDNLNEGNETITVQLMNADGIHLYQGGTGMITIEDNDDTLPTVGLEMTMQDVQEGTGTNIDPMILVKLTDGSGTETQSGSEVTVQFALTEDTAKDPEDFMRTTDASATVTFMPGQTSLALPITIIADEYDEDDEMFTVTLSGETNATLGNSTNRITIKDNDNAPKVSIVEFETENETDTNFNSSVTVTLDRASRKTVTVPYTVADISTDGSDYSVAAEAERQLVFTPDSNTTITTTSMEIPYTIIGDDIGEKSEEFTITLGNPTNGDITGENSIATIRIIDDDSLPVVSIIPDSGEVVENVGIAKFRLTATGLTAITTLMINATPAEVEDDFLADEIIDTTKDFSVEFSDSDGDNIYTGELSVDLDDDEVGEATGEIKLVLNADPDSVAMYQLGETTEGVITIWDDDAPELSISVDKQVEEGDVASVDFMISTIVSPNKNLAVGYDLVESGDFIDNAGPGKSQTLDFTNEAKTATLSIAIINDNEDGEDGSITVTLLKDSANPITYTIAASPRNSATVNVIDGGEHFGRQIISIDVVNSSVEEGNPAEFILSAKPFGIDILQAFKIEYSVTQEGNYISWRTSRSIDINVNTNTATLSIGTLDDEDDEGNGSIRVTLIDSDSNSYNLSSNDNEISAEVEIIDNDQGEQVTQPRISVAQSVVNAILNNPNLYGNSALTERVAPSPTPLILPTISIDAIQPQVNEGSPVVFSITSKSEPSSITTQVKLSVNPIGNFFEFSESIQISRTLQSQESASIVFPTLDDTIAEDDGQLEVSIIPDSSYKIALNQGTSSVIISDALDRQIRQDLLTTSSQAFLPDVVGNMVAKTSDLISQRIQQGFSETRNVALKLGGEQTLEGLIEMSGKLTNEESVSWREILGDSSFTMTFLSGDDFVAPTTIWGIGDNNDLSSNSTSNLPAWSGDVFTGQFGIDALIGQEFLTGLSASISENDIEVGSENTDNLVFTLNSTSLYPYLGWTSPNQDTELRAIAGYGIGEFTINQANYDFEVLASKSYSIALTGSKELYSTESILNGVTKLNIIGNSWLARLYVDGKDNILTDLQTDAHYLRISTQGTHQFEFERGSSLTPLISVGIRDDRKDQLSNFGMELTSGFDYVDPIGLTLSGTGSMLLAGGNGIQKMSVKSTLGYDHGNDELGLTFAISPTWGQSQAEAQNTLWSSNILANKNEVGQYSDGTQISSEIGYGFALGEESRKLNLYSGYEFDAQSDNELMMGTSFSIGTNLGFDLEGVRKFNTKGDEATKYQFNARLSW